MLKEAHPAFTVDHGVSWSFRERPASGWGHAGAPLPPPPPASPHVRSGLFFFINIWLIHQWNRVGLEPFTLGGFGCELNFLTDEGCSYFPLFFCVTFCDSSFKESFDFICFIEFVGIQLLFSYYILVSLWYMMRSFFNSLNFVFCYFSSSSKKFYQFY